MPIKQYILPFFVALATLAGCADKTPPRPIDRLDLVLADPTSTPTARELEAFRAWGEILNFPAERAQYARLQAVQSFMPLVREAVGSLDSVETVLGEALAGYPEAELFAVVTPFNQAVVTHPDGFVFVALNHYLGPESEAYRGFPEYIRKHKQLRQLPADVTEAVIAGATDGRPEPGAPLLSYLLYKGALLDAVSRAMPEGTPDATILGMTPEELEWCRENEGRIWQTLIEKKLLYSTDAQQIARLILPAANSGIINANAPGQAALYSALQLARAYREHNPDAPLLEERRFLDNQSLVKSQYSPALPHGKRLSEPTPAQ